MKTLKVSELIEHLQSLKKSCGDLDVLITLEEGVITLSEHDIEPLTLEEDGEFPGLPRGYEFIEIMVVS